MNWSWFDLHWPWVGLALSGALCVLLFSTNTFRSDLRVSRWRDPVWLAWLAPAAYMLHQFEEYGIDAQGTRFAFPDLLCTSVGLRPYPGCTLPESVFVAINIPAIWIAGLICAILALRYAFAGLGVYCIHFTNSISHLGVALTSGSYNPGALTAGLIQLPISLWVAYVCFFRGGMRRSGMLILVLAGTVFTVVLLASVNLFARGHLSATALLTIQSLNPLFVIVVPLLFNRRIIRK
jgi:hypothetical protein